LHSGEKKISFRNELRNLAFWTKKYKTPISNCKGWLLKSWLPPLILEDEAPEERALEEEQVDEGEDVRIEAGQEAA
jgi:hypothetical protein